MASEWPDRWSDAAACHGTVRQTDGWTRPLASRQTDRQTDGCTHHDMEVSNVDVRRVDGPDGLQFTSIFIEQQWCAFGEDLHSKALGRVSWYKRSWTAATVIGSVQASSTVCTACRAPALLTSYNCRAYGLLGYNYDYHLTTTHMVSVHAGQRTARIRDNLHALHGAKARIRDLDADVGISDQDVVDLEVVSVVQLQRSKGQHASNE
jgi:hypothetical protein